MANLFLSRNITLTAAGRVTAGLLLLFSVSAPLTAQTLSSQDPPAHIVVVDGEVTLERELDAPRADPGMPVVPGDRLRTDRGRVSLLFPDGTALDLDEYSTLDVQSISLLRLIEGRVRITMPRDSRARFTIDTASGSANIDTPGEYRVSILGTTYSQTELVVVRGSAELEGDRNRVRAGAGERTAVWTDDEPSRPERYNTARLDGFDRWSDAQREGRTSGYSTRYLPPELRVYGGDFDRSGAWQYESAYGYVWYPTVAATWRPYFSGYWASVPHLGWTWIGLDAWSWPTHHYGRWGYARDRWFWIPDRRWAPAWVSWSSAPGYVGWCPLGWDNRPVFQLSASIGWVSMPRDRFIQHEYVHRAAGGVRDAAPRAGTFVQSAAPPMPAPGRAVPRGQAGSARSREGTSAVPRDNGRARTRDSDSGQTQTTPGSQPIERPRTQYPFGDFRRGPDSTSRPAAPAEPATGGSAAGRDRPRDSGRGRGDATETARPRDDSGGRVYLPPPTSSGSRGGTRPESPPATAAPPPAGGRSDRGSEGRSSGGTAQPRDGGRAGAGNQGSRGDAGSSRSGDSGRQHDPGSRRPPR